VIPSLSARELNIGVVAVVALDTSFTRLARSRIHLHGIRLLHGRCNAETKKNGEA